MNQQQDLISSFMASIGSKSGIAEQSVAAPQVHPSSQSQTTTSKADTPRRHGDDDNISAMLKKRGNRKSKRFDHPLATLVQAVNKPREYMNHSYSDFSQVPANFHETIPQTIDEMTFAQKVHHILSQDSYSQWISWLPHGRSFKIHLPAVFEREVMLKYFGHKRYSSFLRQLSNHGFKHISKGPDRNTYYHELMLRGMPHLCKHMPEPRDTRRLIPDPDHEPDFYGISGQFPLSDETRTNFNGSCHLNNMPALMNSLSNKGGTIGNSGFDLNNISALMNTNPTTFHQPNATVSHARQSSDLSNISALMNTNPTTFHQPNATVSHTRQSSDLSNISALMNFNPTTFQQPTATASHLRQNSDLSSLLVGLLVTKRHNPMALPSSLPQATFLGFGGESIYPSSVGAANIPVSNHRPPSMLGALLAAQQHQQQLTEQQMQPQSLAETMAAYLRQSQGM